MKIIREVTSTHTANVVVAIECDMCHAKTKEAEYPHQTSDNWATEKGKYNRGCVVSTYHGYKMDMIGPTIREAELCAECATKVLDWIESQGGTTSITQR